MKRTALLSGIAGCAALLAAGEAKAETASATFSPALEQTVQEFPWDSGFIPDSGPLRIKLGALAQQNIALDMAGSAAYDWDAESISFRGEPDGGTFQNELYAEITATVGIDILGFDTELEVGIWDISEIVQGTYRPYLLETNPDRPAEVAEEIGPYNLTQTPFEVGPATGVLTIDWRLDVPGVSYEGSRIDLAEDMGSANNTVASVTVEDESVAMVMTDPEPGGNASVYATKHGLLNSEVSLHIMPTVTVTVYGVDVDIGPFDIEMAYPLLEAEPLAFEPLELTFDVPEPPAGDDGGDEGGDDTGGDGGDDAGDDDGGDTGGDGGADGDDGGIDPSGGVGEDAGGCGCAQSGNHAPSALFTGLLGLGLLGLRRRRT